MLSNKWNSTDNIYSLNRNVEQKKESAVDINVINYALNHTRKETLLYNNRLFAMYINPSEQRKNEYSVNRDWILCYFS